LFHTAAQSDGDNSRFKQLCSTPTK